MHGNAEEVVAHCGDARKTSAPKEKGLKMPENDPLFVISDDLVEQGAAVIKSIFNDASDEDCMTAAAGAFMAIMSEREGGNIIFSHSEDGPFFRFPTKSRRAST
jgi:hypothetical protein